MLSNTMMNCYVYLRRHYKIKDGIISIVNVIVQNFKRNCDKNQIYIINVNLISQKKFIRNLILYILLCQVH